MLAIFKEAAKKQSEKNNCCTGGNIFLEKLLDLLVSLSKELWLCKSKILYSSGKGRARQHHLKIWMTIMQKSLPGAKSCWARGPVSGVARPFPSSSTDAWSAVSAAWVFAESAPPGSRIQSQFGTAAPVKNPG